MRKTTLITGWNLVSERRASVESAFRGMGMGGWAVAGMTPGATPERRSLRTPRREWLHRRLRLRPGTRTFLLSNVPVPPTTPASWNAAAINPAERDRKSTMMLWAAATTHRFRKPRIEANAAVHVFRRQIAAICTTVSVHPLTTHPPIDAT